MIFGPKDLLKTTNALIIEEGDTIEFIAPITLYEHNMNNPSKSKLHVMVEPTENRKLSKDTMYFKVTRSKNRDSLVELRIPFTYKMNPDKSMYLEPLRLEYINHYNDVSKTGRERPLSRDELEILDKVLNERSKKIPSLNNWQYGIYKIDEALGTNWLYDTHPAIIQPVYSQALR